jgi:NarL family two-component system response regulator LiaR
MKNTSSDDLLQAIRDTYMYKPVLQPDIARKLVLDIQSTKKENSSKLALTEREKEVLKEVALGKSNQEIADDLVLSERTVRTHITNILSKLQLSNRTQAALFAIREGYAFIDYSKND